MFVRSLSRQIRHCGRVAGRRYASASVQPTQNTQPTSTNSNVSEVFSVPADFGNTKQILAEVDKVLGTTDTYKTKYPNVDAVQVFRKALQAQGPFKVDDSMKQIFQLMGFEEEQIDQVVNERVPSFYRTLPDGKVQVDFQVFESLYADTPARRNVINEFRVSEEDTLRFEEAEDIDYEFYHRALGKETVEQVERETRAALQSTMGQFDIDVEAVKERITQYVQPSFDRMKDFLIDSVPDVNLLNTDLENLSKMTDPDADLDTESYGFLDKFAPEVRDRIFTEIDNDDFDFEYVKQTKINRVTPETMSQFNQQYFIDKQIVFDRDLRDSLGGGSGGNARQQELINLFAEVSDSNEANKRLEQEVQQLKNRIEMEAGGGADAKQQQEAKQVQTPGEGETFSRKKVIVRDFKHMTPEQIKAWEAKSIKERDDALNSLTETIEAGKNL